MVLFLKIRAKPAVWKAQMNPLRYDSPPRKMFFDPQINALTFQIVPERIVNCLKSANSVLPLRIGC